MVALWSGGRVTVFATSPQIKVQVVKAFALELVLRCGSRRKAGSSEAFDFQAAERQSAAHMIPAPTKSEDVFERAIFLDGTGILTSTPIEIAEVSIDGHLEEQSLQLESRKCRKTVSLVQGTLICFYQMAFCAV